MITRLLHIAVTVGYQLSHDTRENRHDGVAEIGIGEDDSQRFRLEISLRKEMHRFASSR